jgi:hypothetical protein
MNCVVCEKELGNESFEQDGAKFKIHKHCVNEQIKEWIDELLLGYIYINEGKYMRGFYHKPNEEL